VTTQLQLTNMSIISYHCPL